LPILTGETLVAVVCALSGGLFVKLLDNRYRLKVKTIDIEEAFRHDARVDLMSLKEELKAAYSGVEEWKAKYYALFEENAVLKAKYELVAGELSMWRSSSLHDDSTTQ
jgi:hypothetical protein